MKIGIIELAINDNNKSSFYNDQEIGLGKVLANKGHFVDVYKFTKDESKEIVLNDKLKIHYLFSRSIGNNSIIDTNLLEADLDTIICFSDIQLSLPRLFKWAKKNNISFVSYVGTIESYSKSIINKIIMNLYRNIIFSIYRNSKVIAKTGYVKEALAKHGINNVEVVPVGIDLSLLKKDFDKINRNDLKNKYGFKSEDDITLLVGKLEEYRSPLDSLDVFSIIKNNKAYSKLLIVGDGSLKNELLSQAKKMELDRDITIVSKVNNVDMWEVYSLADRLISFNKNEIFGMSIMEAMYYCLPVYAIKAPGPNDIIVDNENGYLFSSSKDMKIKDENELIKQNAHNRIVEHFNWQHMVDTIER